MAIMPTHWTLTVIVLFTLLMLTRVGAQFMYGFAQQQQSIQQNGDTVQPQVRMPFGLPAPASQPGRQQRSLYGGGWHGISGGGGGGWHGISGGGSSLGFSPIGVDHITKEELIALVEAWKEVEKNEPEKKPDPEPEPEPEPEEMEPENNLEPEPEPEAPESAPEEPAKPAGPPPGVPLTVSLPAFVPIQLSAMYTAPIPVGAPAGGAGMSEGGDGGGGGGGDEEAADDGGSEEEKSRKLYRFLGPLPASRNTPVRTTKAKAKASTKSTRTNSAIRPSSRRSKSGSTIRFPIDNPRTFASANYVAPKPRFYRTPAPTAPSGPIDHKRRISALPPPTFLANAPGPLQLVPSSQLLGNWR